MPIDESKWKKSEKVNSDMTRIKKMLESNPNKAYTILELHDSLRDLLQLEFQKGGVEVELNVDDSLLKTTVKEISNIVDKLGNKFEEYADEILDVSETRSELLYFRILLEELVERDEIEKRDFEGNFYYRIKKEDSS